MRLFYSFASPCGPRSQLPFLCLSTPARLLLSSFCNFAVALLRPSLPFKLPFALRGLPCPLATPFRLLCFSPAPPLNCNLPTGARFLPPAWHYSSPRGSVRSSCSRAFSHLITALSGLLGGLLIPPRSPFFHCSPHSLPSTFQPPPSSSTLRAWSRGSIPRVLVICAFGLLVYTTFIDIRRLRWRGVDFYFSGVAPFIFAFALLCTAWCLENSTWRLDFASPGLACSFIPVGPCPFRRTLSGFTRIPAAALDLGSRFVCFVFQLTCLPPFSPPCSPPLLRRSSLPSHRPTLSFFSSPMRLPLNYFSLTPG